MVYFPYCIKCGLQILAVKKHLIFHDLLSYDDNACGYFFTCFFQTGQNKTKNEYGRYMLGFHCDFECT